MASRFLRTKAPPRGGVQSPAAPIPLSASRSVLLWGRGWALEHGGGWGSRALGPLQPCGGGVLPFAASGQPSLQVSLAPSECPGAGQKALTPVSTYGVLPSRPPVLLPPPQGALVSWLEWPVTGFAGQSRWAPAGASHVLCLLRACGQVQGHWGGLSVLRPSLFWSWSSQPGFAVSAGQPLVSRQGDGPSCVLLRSAGGLASAPMLGARL